MQDGEYTKTWPRRHLLRNANGARGRQQASSEIPSDSSPALQSTDLQSPPKGAESGTTPVRVEGIWQKNLIFSSPTTLDRGITVVTIGSTATKLRHSSLPPNLWTCRWGLPAEQRNVEQVNGRRAFRGAESFVPWTHRFEREFETGTVSPQ